MRDLALGYWLQPNDDKEPWTGGPRGEKGTASFGLARQPLPLLAPLLAEAHEGRVSSGRRVVSRERPRLHVAFTDTRPPHTRVAM